MLEAMGLETFEQAETILDPLDRAALEAELTEGKSRFSNEDARIHDLFAAKTKSDDSIAAIGGDDAVALIDAARRTTLLAIEDRARSYLRLKLGVSPRPTAPCRPIATGIAAR